MSLKLRLKYLINISPANAIQSVLIAHFYRLWSFTWWQVTFQLITNLDPNKAHAYDEISVKMIKPRAPSICKLLTLLSKNCLASGHFPDVRKKCNIIPLHKKGDKKLIKSHWLVSLVPLCEKLLEKFCSTQFSIL